MTYKGEDDDDCECDSHFGWYGRFCKFKEWKMVKWKCSSYEKMKEQMKNLKMENVQSSMNGKCST